MITMNLFQIRYVYIFVLNNLEIETNKILRQHNSIQNEIKLKHSKGNHKHITIYKLYTNPNAIIYQIYGHVCISMFA